MHKITAGNGYTYLTSQVAAGDVARGRTALADYYNEHGEAPGVWGGRGLAALPDVDGIPTEARLGAQVSEAQMRALFGMGRHPDATMLERALVKRYHSDTKALRAASLGRQYPTFGGDLTPFEQGMAVVEAAYRAAHNLDRMDPIAPEIRSAWRTQVATGVFRQQWGRDPEAGEIAALIARQTRPKPQAVAGYDVTFSPVKSVSVWWGLADRATARRIRELHHRAVAEAMEWFEDEVAFTREGTHGVRQVDTQGVMHADFDHRSSRAGDPDLHTHVCISAKVATLDGTWLALDGTTVHGAMVALSERYNTILQTLIEQEMGARFVEVAHEGRRSTWEIDGIDRGLCEAFSRRRTGIEVQLRQLTERFQAEHGRLPTAQETHRLSQQATLETRPDKIRGRSEAEERAAWHEQAAAHLGAAQLDQMLGDLGRNIPAAPSPADLALLVEPARRETAAPNRALRAGTYTIGGPDRALAGALDDLAGRALATVAGNRARFRDMNLLAEALRIVRAEVPAAERNGAADYILNAAMAQCVSLDRADPADAPAQLRRADGTSTYRHAHAGLFTTQAALDAEQRVIDAAGRADGRQVRDVDVAVALLHSESEGTPLSQAQRRMVTDMATSGRRVQLAMAPAGTGKTTAMRALADAWTSSGGTIIGLSHQAVAADQLRDAIGETGTCDTLARLTYVLRGIMPNPLTPLPDWANSVDERTLIIVDEAGMAATADLDALTTWALARGASIRLVGDDRQLAAIGGGGILRDIAAEYGTVTLNEPRRFLNDDGTINQAESAASIQIRNGDHEAIGWMLDDGRITAVNNATGTTRLFTDWCHDQQTGRTALMLAYHLETANELNQLAQQWLIGQRRVDPHTTVGLHDGARCGAGDLIVTRRNNRRLVTGPADWVKNRDRWTITRVRPDGALDVVREGTKRSLTLPAWYVREHVELGYASTISACQGVTVDVGRVLFAGDEDRNAAYTALTRGRLRNQAYIVTGGDVGPEGAPFDEAAQLRTAAETMARILDTESQETSATTTLRQNTDPFRQLAADADIYADTIGQAVRIMMGTQAVHDFTTTCDQLALAAGNQRPLSEEPAWQALLDRLLLIGLSGTDPMPILRAAMARRELETDKQDAARDSAAVLCWRLDDWMGNSRTHIEGPLPWLYGLPDTPPWLRQHLGDQQQWATWIAAYRDLIDAETETIQDTAAAWTTDTAPRWAQPLIPANRPDLIADIAVWRAANHVPDNESAPLGPLPAGYDARRRRAYRQLDHQIRTILHTEQWDADVDNHVRGDPQWAAIAARFTAAVQAGRVEEATLHERIRSQFVAALAPALPSEHPAGALYARIASTFPPAPEPIPQRPNGQLLPAWSQHVLDLAPRSWRRTILSDPAWPALVAQLRPLAANLAADTVTVATHLALDSGATGVNLVPLVLSHTRDLQALTDQTGTGPDELPPDPLDVSPTRDEDQFLTNLRAQADALPQPRRAQATPDDRPPATTGHEPANAQPARPDTADTRSDTAASASPPAPERTADLPEPPPDPSTEPPEDLALLGPQTSGDRILQLNTLAADYFTSHYHDPVKGGFGAAGSAAEYIASRFDTDLADDDRFLVGYAPHQWTGLIDHLTATGATTQELIDAGLAKYSNTTHRLHDMFVDRVTLGIRDHHGHLLGFTARANPNTNRDDVPKYLNTPTTPVFKKGESLFGADILTPGATPVVVEGAMDAIAVTLASQKAIGVAPCGSALTPNQVRLMATLAVIRRRAPMILATDNDHAGWQAAARDLPLLADARLDPRSLYWPAGVKDPGEMYATHRAELAQQLDNPAILPSPVGGIINQAANDLVARWHDPSLPDGKIDLPQRFQLWRYAAELCAPLPETPRREAIQAAAAAIAWHTAVAEPAATAPGGRVTNWTFRDLNDTEIDDIQHTIAEYVTGILGDQIPEPEPETDDLDTDLAAEQWNMDHSLSRRTEVDLDL